MSKMRIPGDERGYIQVYTGDGKGKTTAALGLALRAAGHGRRTFIAQFMKKMFYGEQDAIHKYLSDFITIRQYGLPGFHHQGKAVSEKERDAALTGVEAVRLAIASGDYPLIVMDEVNILVYFNIIEIQIITDILDSKPPMQELILTGRNAPPEFIERADLVTEMKEIKHYYRAGVQARDGIEK